VNQSIRITNATLNCRHARSTLQQKCSVFRITTLHRRKIANIRTYCIYIHIYSPQIKTQGHSKYNVMWHKLRRSKHKKHQTCSCAADRIPSKLVCMIEDVRLRLSLLRATCHQWPTYQSLFAWTLKQLIVLWWIGDEDVWVSVSIEHANDRRHAIGIAAGQARHRNVPSPWGLTSRLPGVSKDSVYRRYPTNIIATAPPTTPEASYDLSVVRPWWCASARFAGPHSPET